MAGGLYRGTAFWRNVMAQLRAEYFRDLPGQVGGLSKALFEQQRPIFEDMIKQYYGGAAGLGQAVPGEGLSSAGIEGLLEDVMGNYMAQITGQALGAAQMPWQPQFGQAPDPTFGAQQEHAARTVQSQRMSEAMGGGCCFIFIEANNGVLNRIARRYRDEHGTAEQRIGYKLLALFLVPLMREHRIVKESVKWLMVKPMIWAGKGFFGEQPSGKIFYPFLFGWLKIFESIGRSAIEETKKWLPAI